MSELTVLPSAQTIDLQGYGKGRKNTVEYQCLGMER